MVHLGNRSITHGTRLTGYLSPPEINLRVTPTNVLGPLGFR